MNDRLLNIFNGQPLGDNYPAGSIDRLIEDILLKGYAKYTPQIDIEINEINAEIDKMNEDEIAGFGFEKLKKINDVGVVRNPFLKSKITRKIIRDDIALKILKTIFGKQYILHVNRFVISNPHEIHPASAWHREPPYNDFIAQKPMALTFIFMPNGSSVENNGLALLQGSHKWPKFPSDQFVFENEYIPTVLPGECVVIDSSLFHRGGQGGALHRRSIVTIFTTPIIKQQTDLAEVVKNEYSHLLSEFEEAEFFYGLFTKVEKTDLDYRTKKLNT